MYGTDTQYGSANSADPNQGGAPPSSAGSWAPGTLGRDNCFGAIHGIFNQANGAYAPDAWLNGHDHANTMAYNQDFKTNTMFITSGTGSLWQSGDGGSANKFSGVAASAWPQQSPNGQAAASGGSFPANIMFSSTAYDASGANTLGNGGITLLKATPASLKADYWITAGGTPAPAPCDINAEYSLTMSSNGPNNSAAVLASVFPGIPTADSSNNTCAICTNLTVNPACGMFVQTLNGGYHPSGYIVPYGAAVLPTKPVFSCTSVRGSAPTCTCSAAAQTYRRVARGGLTALPSSRQRSSAPLSPIPHCAPASRTPSAPQRVQHRRLCARHRRHGVRLCEAAHRRCGQPVHHLGRAHRRQGHEAAPAAGRGAAGRRGCAARLRRPGPERVPVQGREPHGQPGRRHHHRAARDRRRVRLRCDMLIFGVCATSSVR